MNPLLLWEWRPYVLASLIVFATVYSIGWICIRRRSRTLATRTRLLAMAGAMTCVLIALVSPIDFLSEYYLSVQMVQNTLFWFPIPILLLLAHPLPFWSWGFKRLGPLLNTLLSEKGTLLRAIKLLTSPELALVLSAVVLWVWHFPTLYNLALANRYVHDFQHISFVIAFLVYWWPLIGSPPQGVRLTSNLSRYLYLYLGAMQGMVLAGLILSNPGVLYTHYLGLPGQTFASVLADQRVGGLIMLIPGAVAYLLMAIYTMDEE